MPDVAKKPCRICGKWFRPDVRVGNRQRACGRPECQAMRRKRTQAAWRARNPGYFVDWRIQARFESDQPPEPFRLPHPLSGLPWDIAQDEFGRKGADFIGALGSVLLRSAKDQLKGQIIDSAIDPGALLIAPAKDQFRAQVADSS
jgi:hypothetical protein